MPVNFGEEKSEKNLHKLKSMFYSPSMNIFLLNNFLLFNQFNSL